MTIDRDYLNRQLAEVKKSMGILGSGIKPIDADAWAAATKVVDAGMADAASDAEALNQQVAALHDRLSAMEKSPPANKALNFAASIAGAQALGNVVSSLSQPFLALDTATAQLRTLGDEAAQMAPSLREAALVMSQDLPFSAAEIQTTMFDAMASGVKGGEQGLKDFADTAAKLATGGGAGIGDATKLIAGQLNAYGKTAEEAAHFSDVFFNTVNYGVTSIPELSAVMANVVPTAASLGVEIEGLGASIAVMTAKGVPAAQSTTKLNQLLLELAKPGAALKPILDAAGVSLESLNRDDLPVTLAKVKKAMEEAGTASVQAFSSSEAAAAFNVLSGDIEGFTATFADVSTVAGSAQNAYDQMGSSIEVQSKKMLSAVQSFITQGLDLVGPGVVGAVNAAGQLAPTVTVLAGLGNIVPAAAVERLKSFAGNIVKSMIPALAGQAVATGGATTAQYGLNAAISANPIGASIAVIVAAVAATKLLSDALHETAAEKLEDAQAEVAILQEQRSNTEQRYKQIAAQSAQVQAYKLSVDALQAQQAASKDSTLTEAERTEAADAAARTQERLATRTADLASVFPTAATAAGDYAAKLRAMQAEAEKGVDQLIGVAGELHKLDTQLAAAQSYTLHLDTAVAAEDLETTLADTIDTSLATVAGNITRADSIGEAISAAVTGSIGAMPFGDTVSEWLLGTSAARQTGEQFAERFKQDVFNAKTASEIQAARAKMVATVKLQADQLGLDPKEQAQVIAGIKAFADKRSAELEAVKKNESSLSTQTAADVARTVADAVAAGGKMSSVVAKVAGAYEISSQKVKEIALDAELGKAGAAGALTAEALEKMGAKYGLSGAEAAKLLATQQAQKQAAEQTATAVANIGEAFATSKKAASDAVASQTAELSGLYKQRREATTREARAAADAAIAAAKRAGRAQVGELNRLSADEESARRALGLVKGKQLKDERDIADQIAGIRRNNQQVLATIEGQSIAEESARKRAELSRQIAQERADVEAEISAARSNKELTLAARTALADALDEKLTAVTLKGLDARAKLERDAAAAAMRQAAADSAAAQQEIAKRESEDLATRIQILAAAEAKAGDAGLANAEELGALRLQQLRKQNRATIDALIETIPAVKAAQASVDEAIASGDPTALQAAEQNRLLARAKAIAEDTTVINAAKLQAQQTAAAEEEVANAVKLAEINAIPDLAQRKRRLALLEAQKTYSAQLAAVRGNAALELAAYKDYVNAKKVIDEDYLRATNAVYDATRQLVGDLTDAFRDIWSTAAAKQRAEEERDHQKRLADIKSEEDALKKKLQRGQILWEEYQAEQDKLDDRRREAQEQQAERTSARDNDKRQRISAAIQKTADQQYKLWADATAKGETAYDRLAVAAGASFAAQIAAGQKWSDAMLIMLLENMSHALTVYIPEIMAASVGLLGPIAGPIAAGAAIVTIQAYAAIARAQLGAQDGVVEPTTAYARPRGAKDTMQIWITPKEAIMNEEATARNRDALRWANRTKSDLADYYLARSTRHESNVTLSGLQAEIGSLTTAIANLDRKPLNARQTVATMHKFGPLRVHGRDLVAAIDSSKRIALGSQ